MDFEKYVADFLNDTVLHDWSLMNCLRYLEGRVLFSSDSENDILMHSNEHLRRVANPLSCMRTRRQKPLNYPRTPKKFFEEKKFLTFLVKLIESGKWYVRDYSCYLFCFAITNTFVLETQ